MAHANHERIARQAQAIASLACGFALFSEEGQLIALTVDELKQMAADPGDGLSQPVRDVLNAGIHDLKHLPIRQQTELKSWLKAQRVSKLGSYLREDKLDGSARWKMIRRNIGITSRREG